MRFHQRSGMGRNGVIEALDILRTTNVRDSIAQTVGNKNILIFARKTTASLKLIIFEFSDETSYA